VGRYLAQCPITKIYTSPLQRAQQTVQALLPFLQPRLPLTVSPWLQEIYLPDWEGQPYATVRSRDAATYHCWQTTPEQLRMGSERQPFYPVQDVYDRARQFWQTTLPQHRGQTWLVVGHGSSNQALINTAINLTARQHHLCQQTHGGLTVLDFADTANCTAQVHCLNVTLDGRLPKLKAGKQGLRILLWPLADGDPNPPDLPRLPDINLNAILVAQGKHPTAFHSTPPGDAIAQALLRQHPETVVLSAAAAQMIHQWPQAIQRSLSAQDTARLTTVLAIAPRPLLQSCFRNLLQIPHLPPSLTLSPHTLSVIHYPASGRSPILQGINLSPTHIL
jgi:probable phosphoglycerate mutase